MKDFWKVPAILLAATLMLRNTKEGGRMPKYIFLGSRRSTPWLVTS